jgi:hypothetical protein
MTQHGRQQRSSTKELALQVTSNLQPHAAEMNAVAAPRHAQHLKKGCQLRASVQCMEVQCLTGLSPRQCQNNLIELLIDPQT